jgi:hypothetical protein
MDTLTNRTNQAAGKTTAHPIVLELSRHIIRFVSPLFCARDPFRRFLAVEFRMIALILVVWHCSPAGRFFVI